HTRHGRRIGHGAMVRSPLAWGEDCAHPARSGGGEERCMSTEQVLELFEAEHGGPWKATGELMKFVIELRWTTPMIFSCRNKKRAVLHCSFLECSAYPNQFEPQSMTPENA